MDKYEVKVLLAIRDSLADENRSIKKLSIAKNILFFAGALMVLVSVLESLEPHIPIWVISILGVGGGFSIGFGVYFETYIKQWPVLKKLLNSKLVESEAKRHET